MPPIDNTVQTTPYSTFALRKSDFKVFRLYAIGDYWIQHFDEQSIPYVYEIKWSRHGLVKRWLTGKSGSWKRTKYRWSPERHNYWMVTEKTAMMYSIRGQANHHPTLKGAKCSR